MRLRILITFLTLVASAPSLVFAATDTSSTPKPVFKRAEAVTESTQGQLQNPQADLENTLQMAPAPATSGRYLIPVHHRDWTRLHSLGFGYGTGVFDVEKRSSTLLFLNYLYTHYYEDGYANEMGLDLSQSSLMGLNASKKILFTGHSSWYEPYWKVGMSLYLYSGDYLAGIINYKRYVARISIGLDNFLFAKKQFKWDLGIGYGLLGYSVTTQFTVAIPSF